MKKFTSTSKQKITASQKYDEVQRGVELLRLRFDEQVPQALEFGWNGLNDCINRLRNLPDPYRVFPEPEFQGDSRLDDIDEEYQYYLAVADELEDVCNRIKELM